MEDFHYVAQGFPSRYVVSVPGGMCSSSWTSLTSGLGCKVEMRISIRTGSLTSRAPVYRPGIPPQCLHWEQEQHQYEYHRQTVSHRFSLWPKCLRLLSTLTHHGSQQFFSD